MTINEAIKKLQGFHDWYLGDLIDADLAAVKLGIEALKREVENRKNGGVEVGYLLPGEDH